MNGQSIYQPADFASPAFVQGFLPTAFTTTTVTFAPGSARSYTSDWVGEYTGFTPGAPGSITINTAVIGANGTFPTGIAAITPATGLNMAPVYLVSNSAGTTDGSLNGLVIPAMVIATTATGFVPDGYDSYREIGFVLVDNAGHLVAYSINGNYERRSVMLQDRQVLLAGGAATTPTKVDIIFGVGGNALAYNRVCNLNLLTTFTNNTNDDTASLIPFGLTAASLPPVVLQGQVNAVAVTQNVIMNAGLDTGTNGAAINYNVSAGDCTLSLWLSGFDYNMPFSNMQG